jgi:predicted RNA binding protein YcfA (HicA-like mRNA interferase family)
MPEERTKIVRVLLKFGFLAPKGAGKGDHEKYSRNFDSSQYGFGELMTIVDSDREIPNGTFSAILRQVKLDRKNFTSAEKCTFSKENYELNLVMGAYEKGNEASEA